MSTNRTNDLLLLFHGGAPFTQTFPLENDISIVRYQQERDKLNHGRALLTVSCGTVDVASDLVSIMKTISAHVKSRFETLGQVCLLGRSNGCSLALAVAAELNAKGITDLTFVGLSDVTMYAAGRNPPVPKVGALQPDRDPEIAGGAIQKAGRFGIGKVFGSYPSAENTIPHVTLDAEIKAKTKINQYQTQGNHAKTTLSGRWIWWSSMTDGEVHGEIENFTNRKFKVKASSDLDRHIELNTQERWKAMTGEASNALATFPPEALQP